MEAQNHHRERVIEALREELTEIISLELADPRAQGVEVVEVHADPALKHAQIQVVCHGGPVDAAVVALEHAKGYLKSQLAIRLDRRVPELHFSATADLGPRERVQKLLKRIRRGRPRA